MNCPRHCTEREGLDLFWNLPTGRIYMCGKPVDIYRPHTKPGCAKGVGGKPVPNKEGCFFLLCMYRGRYVQNYPEQFIQYLGIRPEDIRAHHISKTPPQCCPKQCEPRWLCTNCGSVLAMKPCFVDGQFSCCRCAQMTVQFEAPEPTGKELLREILKPGMTVKLCDEVCHVASSYASNTFVKPAYKCGCFLLLDFSPTHFSEKDFKKRVGKSVESITRSDIEILYDPTEAK